MNTDPLVPTTNHPPEPVKWVIGGSHIVRWRRQIPHGTLLTTLEMERLLAYGGTPIWSKKTFELALVMTGTSSAVGIVVPDFRIGNRICLTRDIDGPTLQDGYESIDQRVVEKEYDVAMLTRSIDALRVWHAHFGSRARYVLWGLLANQVYDRLAGKYIESGKYEHPIFEWNQILTILSDLNVVDLTPLLRMPMHEIVRLFIDNDAHPSRIGIHFLDSVLCKGASVLDAYRGAVTKVENDLFHLSDLIAKKYKNKVLLTGRSVWLDTLSKYMGATGAKRLAEAGLILAPVNRALGQPSISELMGATRAGDCYALVFVNNGAVLAPTLAHAFGTDHAAWKDVREIDWEATVAQVLTESDQLQTHARTLPQNRRQTVEELSTISDGLIESGPTRAPTWDGIRRILEDIVQGRIELNRVGGTRIEGDALLTKDGIAFLIGGNHSVMKFSTGVYLPSEQSLANFNFNISSRIAITEILNVRYAHVIFPDKQSVLADNFPYQPVHRLGDAYVKNIPSPDRVKVLYPADKLKNDNSTVFLPLDTHLTDHGSLAVLRLMLEMTGIKAHSSLERVASRIVKKQVWAGDLGSKFTPKLIQEGLILDPDWPVKIFSSPGGFNDGMIDLVFNAEAEFKRTALLFGDSFFRMMLKHLSAVFTRVICLRTRHFHPEMLTLIKPDLIFTGNAERYLSGVASDLDAHAFALYPELKKGVHYSSDPEFLNAWRAVTSPKSSHANTFFRELNLAH